MAQRLRITTPSADLSELITKQSGAQK